MNLLIQDYLIILNQNMNEMIVIQKMLIQMTKYWSFLSRLDGKILDEIDPIQETFKYRKTEVIIDDKKTIDKKILNTRKIKIRSDSNFIRKIKLISESNIIRKSDSNFIRNRKFISDSEIEKIADYVGSENFTKILSKDFRKRRKLKNF
ncbi:unnamed protein product [Blepharisma stoltei]|uniref:Uncharacterized protein n=1 Tax=Blepharisma stoltei TaxID=1481888 RepID=A0AAU9KG31_9CILI|nr:unnamed protein product [Blepharisma stoltei]